MAVSVIMPKSGQSVESCILTAWHKQVGEPVQEGESLFSYETDKAAFTEQAKATGTLLAVFAQADDDVPCLESIAVIGEAGEDFSDLRPGGQTAAAPMDAAPADAPATGGASASANMLADSSTDSFADSSAVSSAGLSTDLSAEGAFSQNTSNADSLIASPRARAAAARTGVALEAAVPTGPYGRILERDVLAVSRIGIQGEALSADAASTSTAATAPTSVPAAAPAGTSVATPAPANAGEYRDEKLPNIRKLIAKSMHESLQGAAQLTNQLAFDATELLRLRKQFKALQEAQPSFPNITINDLLLYAVSRVLPAHPALNAHFLGDSMRYFTHVNLGIAVDTPRGLLVPTLFQADQKSLKEIAVESKALGSAAQSGSMNPDLLTGGTFTVSNLGALGTEFFTPILNPPQTAILGVGCTVERVRSANGKLEAYPAMGLSLTYDHRAVDGAPAAKFLQDLKSALEGLTALLV